MPTRTVRLPQRSGSVDHAVGNDRIAEAIDAAAERARETRTSTSIEILNAGHRWIGDKDIRINAPPPSKANQPTLLMYDETQLAWRAVVLPAGTSWRVVPDQAGVWTPDLAPTRSL
jgi:hypothetical protein